MGSKRPFLVILLAFYFAIAAPHQVQAVVLGPDVLGFDFRFNNPGARANAMGGAFIGLADDASAAYTNPAGLTVLTKQELSVEYKYGTTTTRVKDGLGEHDYESSDGNLSFVSYATPKEKATITLFKHKMIDSTSGTTWKDDITDSGVFSEVELNADTYGLGFGMKVAPPLSLGLTINFSQMDYKTISTRMSNSDPGYIDNLDRINGSGKDEHVIVSMLWNVFDEFNFGAAYHEGAEFTFERIRYRQDTSVPLSVNDDLLINKVYNHVLHVPEFYGVGISYSFPIGLTLAADANHIKYSQILDDALDDSGQPTNAFEIEDTWEYHAGLEYVFALASTPIALRCGYFFRPNHSAREISSGMDTGGTDDNIYTVGVGAVLSENLQVDVSGSFGDLVNEGSFSLVYRLE
ncbi:MAG: outer membrane protein transport protein [Proteobacteria bacterium]|nr:outer membrane protein transport protein [Pseudomonadota bacterium]MBU1738588.1 outer membrane protein transport protein [Pseudomonadota bacterium]